MWFYIKIRTPKPQNFKSIQQKHDLLSKQIFLLFNFSKSEIHTQYCKSTVDIKKKKIYVTTTPHMALFQALCEMVKSMCTPFTDYMIMSLEVALADLAKCHTVQV